MEPNRLWCRMVVLGPDGRARRTEVIGGDGRPDLETVDAIAHLALAAARAGGRLVLQEVEPELDDLLRLAGLPVEVQGQPERGEEPLRIEERQEEGHLGDLPA